MDHYTTWCVVILTASTNILKFRDSPCSANRCTGDGDDEFLVTAFGTIEYDDKGEPMKVRTRFNLLHTSS